MQQREPPAIRLQEVIRQIPFTYLFLVVIGFTTWVVDIPQLTSTYLINTSESLSQFQIWRIFISSFCTTSIFTLVLVFSNLYTFLPKVQLKTSSIYILVNFAVIGAVIQFLYALCLLMLPEGIRLSIAKGDIHGIWFNLMVKYCYFNTKTKIKLCCFPLKLKKIVYPFVLLAVLMLWNFSIQLDAIIGIGLAFIQCRFLKAEMIPITSDLCCGFLSGFGNWVRAGSNISTPFYGIEEAVISPRGSNSTKQSNLDYFKSRKGVRLSDA